MAILAIDQGTSATKAVVFADDGSVLSVAEVPVAPSYLPGGGVEHDPLELLRSVEVAGLRAVSETREPVQAVALANQGETVMAWDRRTGRPLSPAIVWQDRRSEEICAELSEHGDHVASSTGLVLDPYFSAPKMAWLRRHRTPEGVVTTSDAWLLHQLTGAFVTDASTASRSLLVDLDTGKWSGELLELFGLQDEPLPEIVGSDTVVGTTSTFGAKLPVAGCVVDQPAALLAQGCTQPGQTKCTYGTGAFVLASTGPTPGQSTTGLATSVAWSARGARSHCLDGQVYTAGSAVRWLQELGILDHPASIDELAAGGAASVLCIPALAGLAAPWWRPEATATLTGLSLSSGRGNVVAALMEGIASQVTELVHAVATDTQAPVERLRVDGGLTRSRYLVQAQADLLQVPVDVYPSEHATAAGAAALARLAMDPALGVSAASWPWTPSATYEPQWSADRASSHLSRTRTITASTTEVPR